MITEQDMEDILASDVKIVDHTKRVNGRLVFPGQFMPDGREIAIEAPEKLDSGVLTTWCNLLRGEYSARKDRKEAEARRRAEAERPVDSPQAASSGPPGGRDGSDQAGGEADEAPLEKVIESKVTALAAKVRHCRQVRAEAHTQFVEAERRLEYAIEEHDRACDLLDFLRRGHAPKDSRANRKEPSPRKGHEGGGSRRSVVADSVPSDE